MTLADFSFLPPGLQQFFTRRPVFSTFVPLLAVLKETKSNNVGMIEDNLLSISYGQIIRKSIDTDSGLLPRSFETYQIVEQDQIIFRFTDLQNDKRSLRSALAHERGIITNAYVATEIISRDYHPEYLNLLFRAFDLSKVFYGLGGGVRQSISYSDISRLPIPAISLDEQRKIVGDIEERLSILGQLSPASKGINLQGSVIDKFVWLINEIRDAYIVEMLLGSEG